MNSALRPGFSARHRLLKQGRDRPQERRRRPPMRHAVRRATTDLIARAMNQVKRQAGLLQPGARRVA